MRAFRVLCEALRRAIYGDNPGRYLPLTEFAEKVHKGDAGGLVMFYASEPGEPYCRLAFFGRQRNGELLHTSGRWNPLSSPSSALGQLLSQAEHSGAHA